MSDLDSKLREILEEVEDEVNNTGGVSTKHRGRLVAQIKQAFAEEGYVKVSKDNQDKIKTATIYSINHGQYELMTGQEWYERFEKELNNHPIKLQGTEIMRAAKKAAGLE